MTDQTIRLIRTKIRTKEDNKDIVELLEFVKSTKRELLLRFDRSHYRSKICENLQGLEDCITKKIKRENNKEEQKLKSLEQKVQDLEKRIEEIQKEKTNTYSLDLDIFDYDF